MDPHAEKDKDYHARIASVYDYVTNEPRRYPNELLFRPIDRVIRPAERMLDLGCGTGQMIFRYGHLARHITAVDHSRHMLAEARRKASEKGWHHIDFVESDLHDFVSANGSLEAGLITCVGVLHHLEPPMLTRFVGEIASLLTPGGQLVIAEPINADGVPEFIRRRNQRSVLVERLQECMPPEAEDPDEEPLEESHFFRSLDEGNLNVSVQSKGFEMFHVNEPITLTEKLFIRYVYFRYRHRGDVLAVMAEKPRL